MRPGFTALTAPALAFGYAFLYLPIALLIIYSFNASRLVAVWGGWSLHWYASLWQDDQLLASIRVSLVVGLLSATGALVIGGAAGLALARVPRFTARTFFVAMLLTPLVMPEVITGLSLLLLFVALDIDRGVITVTLAHMSFSMTYVAVVVRARLLALDESLEEAALDLGAPPARVFRRVTLPLIAPALVSGWLLAFTLSLDDLVIASFTTGPGATTLPMRIYSQVRLGVAPEINAVSTLMIAAVALCLLVATWARGRGSKS